jgi:ADP-heptose:LPS heptosyltransferase
VSPQWIQRSGGAALLLAPSFRVAWQALRSGASLRIGTPTDWRRLLLTHPVDASVSDRHQREVYRAAADHVIELLGGGGSSCESPSEELSGGHFCADPEGRAWWESVGSPGLLLHPWASGRAAKRWPLEHWVRLGEQFASVVVTGGPSGDDAETAEQLAARLGAPCAAGSTALSPAAWASLAQAVPQLVLPDTGLAHLASAAGARPLVLFGATDPARYAPTKARVLAAASMADLQVSDVVRDLRRAGAPPAERALL